MHRFKRIIRYFKYGRRLLNDGYYLNGQKKNKLEYIKTHTRTEIINYLLSLYNRETRYLEIGVRNPDDNFNRIRANAKYSVDPGLDYERNPVDFKITSDSFFSKLRQKEILSSDIRFDVIFIDGLHLAEQVDKDVKNSLDYLAEDGFIVLHDCNPPTEWHSREEYRYELSPAKEKWNGTTWKAFMKWRSDSAINSCCIDTDWGVGILSKKHPIGRSIKHANQFYEFQILDADRKEQLNLMDFNEFKELMQAVS